MCYGKPKESLEIARSRLTPEQWTRFEREFDDFCVVQGLPDKWAYWPTYDWAKWAFFCARPVEPKWIDIRTRNAHYDRIAIAMMDDEQAVASLARWRERK